MGQRRCVLRRSRAGDPAAIGAHIVGTAERLSWKRSVNLPALHRAAKNDVVAAPGVVRSIGRIRLEGTRKVGAGESRDLIRQIHFLQCLVERQ